MKKPSYPKAISEKCKDCIYDPMAGGTWRQQVTACKDTSCALYNLRPLEAGVRHGWYVYKPVNIDRGARK